MELTDDEVQVKMNAWFSTLHRLARIQEHEPMAPAFVPVPLREDVVECVERGWVMAYDDGRKGELRLVLRPEGWDMYDAMCQDLADQGRPIQGWKPGRHRNL